MGIRLSYYVDKGVHFKWTPFAIIISLKSNRLYFLSILNGQDCKSLSTVGR